MSDLDLANLTIRARINADVLVALEALEALTANASEDPSPTLE